MQINNMTQATVGADLSALSGYSNILIKKYKCRGDPRGRPVQLLCELQLPCLKLPCKMRAMCAIFSLMKRKSLMNNNW